MSSPNTSLQRSGIYVEEVVERLQQDRCTDEPKRLWQYTQDLPAQVQARWGPDTERRKCINPLSQSRVDYDNPKK